MARDGATAGAGAVDGCDERQIGDLRVRIDRTLCVGFAECIKESPEGFVLDEGGVAVFLRPEQVDRAALLRACDACPVDAVTVWDSTGSRIVP